MIREFCKTTQRLYSVLHDRDFSFWLKVISCLQRSSLKLTPGHKSGITESVFVFSVLTTCGFKSYNRLLSFHRCAVLSTFRSHRNRGRGQDPPEDFAPASGRDFYFNTQKQQTHSFFSNFPNLMFTQEMWYETKACCRFSSLLFQAELLTTRGVPLHF